MKIYNNSSPNLKNLTIILGFFDGIHKGHREVISAAVDYAKKHNTKTLLLTFEQSPAEYFHKSFEYIYNRNTNYQLIESLGVDYIVGEDFYKLAEISAENYLSIIVERYAPNAIFTGFNYTFGKNKTGTPELLHKYTKEYNYKYFCIDPIIEDNEIISSSLIKSYLHSGEINKVNHLLNNEFIISSKVVHGLELGRKLGFPTANLIYPQNIVKLPYGVYKGLVFDKPAVINWGIKPTIGGTSEVIEAHILNYSDNLYDKTLKIRFQKYIRKEKKFNSLEELKEQIKKDIENCLK